MATIKKAQNGAKTKPTNNKVADKTYVKKVDAKKLMKDDNSMSIRIQNNKRKLADYYGKMDVSAALMYGDEDGSLLKDAKKQDSISKSASKKADSLRKNPRFKVENESKFKSKKKMKNGGSLSGLKASNKRVGSVDPKGAYTTVQKKALAGAKGKASLTKDKQLGATKMAKRGMSIKKK